MWTIDEKDLLMKKWLIAISRTSKNNLLNKRKSNLSQFSFSHWLLYHFFFFCYKSVCKFSKTDKISSASFHYIQKWRKFENTEGNVSPKALVSNVILVFLDQLKPPPPPTPLPPKKFLDPPLCISLKIYNNELITDPLAHFRPIL